MINRKSLTALAAAFAVIPTSFAGTLTFTVDGVEDRGGDLYIGVQTEEQFLQNDGIANEVISQPKAGSHTVSFELPTGDYSVSVWHDSNGDGEFGRTEYGVPTEGWAMLNGASLRGMPKFDEVKISLTAEGASVTEAIIYSD
ncbi:MAG: DUF2141 domain-containing protein [Pseudomonadota bacterium]